MNPFEKRATEYIRDDLAFLPYVTPEPLIAYLQHYAQEDVLFDRLVTLIGSPGSGKTTLARLFLLPTLMTLLQTRSIATHTELIDALTRCHALADGAPVVAGCRIPLESHYRDCWELPYDDETRHRLLFCLLQARTVLAWLRGFEDAGIALAQVTLVPRADAAATLEAIGGTSIANVREVARAVERDVYGVSAGLVAPPTEKLPPGATAAYHPFDVIESFEIPYGEQRLRLKPLVVCDDAQVLHPRQVDGLVKWFARREIRVARWVLTRLDALRPQDVLRQPGSASTDTGDRPGFNRSREVVSVWMQSITGKRGDNRRAFRRIAQDMSSRYLLQMPVFARQGLKSLEELLEGVPPHLPASSLKQLQDSLTSGPRRSIGPTRRAHIEQLVDTYLASDQRKFAPLDSPEGRAMMIRILLERYLKRVPQSSLFDNNEDPEPPVPLRADSTLRNAAEMQLYHEYGRPFFFGFDTLCDAASENAEQFLRLAGHLVAQIETQVIRGHSAKLTPARQDKLLRERATRMLEDEDFPGKSRVMRLCQAIVKECLVSTREPNAPLGEGANAWGILQEEFDTIAAEQPELARIIQSGLAYNMFALVRDHGTKGEIWCLIELSGMWSLRYGLSLKRGQFLERKVRHLLEVVAS